MEECNHVAILVSLGITLSFSFNSHLVDFMAYRKLDITFIINLMDHFMQIPYVERFNVVKQILRYVMGTKDLVLKYDKLPSFVLLGFSDSNYGGDKDDKKSTSTYIFSIGLGVISWDSKN